MKSFERLLSLLATIPDPRRAEGKLYQLRHVLLFSIFAMISGANSYRSLRTYFRVHRQRLNEAFGIDWKSAPAHTAIRYILHRLSAAEVERVFREHAANLNCAPAGANARVVAFDGKTLKGSFDSFNDIRARQLLSAFAVDTGLVLAHIEIDEKSNEIRPCKSCCRNSAWRVISPPPTRSTVKKTFEAAALANAHLIVQLKDNQPTLCQNVDSLCEAAEPLSSVKTVDSNRRNRHETRTITVFDATAAVAQTEWQPHVAAIIQVERDVNVRQADTGFWKRSLETSIYLSNRPVAAKIAAVRIREASSRKVTSRV